MRTTGFHGCFFSCLIVRSNSTSISRSKTESMVSCRKAAMALSLRKLSRLILVVTMSCFIGVFYYTFTPHVKGHHDCVLPRLHTFLITVVFLLLAFFSRIHDAAKITLVPHYIPCTHVCLCIDVPLKHITFQYLWKLHAAFPVPARDKCKRCIRKAFASTTLSSCP
jgi:hypothetical protein